MKRLPKSGNQPCWWMIPLPVSFAVWGMAGGIRVRDAAGLQARYQREQAEIEFLLADLRLRVLRDRLSPFEAQGIVDAWLKQNESRLRDQAALAEELDRVAPLPSIPAAAAPPAFLTAGSPQARRFSELENAEAGAMRELRAKASGIELQGLVDAWAHSREGEAILQEKRDLAAQAARQAGKIPGLEPAALSEPPAGASPARREQHRLEAEQWSLFQKIRAAAPQAGPWELQALAEARKEEFEALRRQAADLQPQVYREGLEAEAAALRSSLSLPPEPVMSGDSGGPAPSGK